jgi:DMSO/TMAO reductase YedYZ heme-binding membrane subunit
MKKLRISRMNRSNTTVTRKFTCIGLAQLPSGQFFQPHLARKQRELAMAAFDQYA